MTETEYEFEYEDDLGTIASKEKGADEDQIFSVESRTVVIVLQSNSSSSSESVR